VHQLGDRVFYAPGGVNIGVVLSGDDGAIMIDSGLNDSAARKVVREIESMDRQVRAIITTHGHADHFGGNAWTVRRTGARVWAPEWDETVLRHPLFQPLCLYAGADPPESLRTRFLLAAPSPVDEIYEEGPLTVNGVDLEVISLAGHSGNQMGLLIDGVFFCADVVFPENVLDRYRVPYLFSVRDHLKALDRAEQTLHSYFVPGHGDGGEHIGASVELNRRVVLEIAEQIVELCREPEMPEEILARLLQKLDVNPADPGAYYLLHPTVFAFLTYLEAEGQVEHAIQGGRSLWRAA
jgi:glyoxylase-like metal-dependent hydrolase (beta-lactamase superfamily II)